MTAQGARERGDLPADHDGDADTPPLLGFARTRHSDVPLSLNTIKRKIPRKVAHATLRAAIEHYKRLGCVVEGSKGVMWVSNTNPEFWRISDSWERR